MNIKKVIKNPYAVSFVIIIVIITANNISNNKNNTDNTDKKIKQVSVMKIKDHKNETELKIVGSVQPQTSVDVTARTRRKKKAINFDIGDLVVKNKTLINLHDNSTLINLGNAKTNYSNTKNNLLAIERLTNESIRLAETGVNAANESIKSAEIGVKIAQDNLKNAKNIREKNNEDIKNNAIVSYADNLNTVFGSLDQVNFIIQADDNNIQLDGINDVLGVKNLSSITKAKASYHKVKNKYNELIITNPSSQTIETAMKDIALLLNSTLTMIDNTINVLDSTITSSNFSKTTLNTYKTNFINLSSTISAIKSGADNTLHSLENITLNESSEIDTFENALLAAQNQLDQAKNNQSNALAALENAKKTKDQQITASMASVDNAEGQFNLALTQTADLQIKAPIDGTITSKPVEPGTEINSGQVVAQIQKTDILKIIINIPSFDIHRIALGQTVKIGDDLEGVITLVNPTADPVTKKIGAEILFDNQDKQLISGTFVDIIIPLKKNETDYQNSFFAPLRAINISQDEKFAFVASTTANSTIAIKKIITIGQTEGVMIEVLSGLEAGELLITDGAKELENNENIKIITY